MCGVNGIFAYHYAANPIDRAELGRTRDHAALRGPDGKGEWVSSDGRVGFGHRRLSIIDLSDAGAQPMSNADGSLVVTFNGEIYNYRRLRRDLEAKGYFFHSNSDTEVLLHLYAEKGDAMVHDLRGMFAFAIWDVHSRQVFLARDPYGIKPLYYADDGWTFRFASQVKALLAGRAISRDPESAGLVGFFLWGSVPEPFTSHLAIRALPAGCTLKVDQLGAREPKRYHSIAAVYRAAEADAPNSIATRRTEDVFRAIQAALLDSVRHHLVADVPVGAFLSAGIDSGALVGLIRDAGQCEIQTVTLAFQEFRGSQEDEAPLAEQVARHFGTRHATRVVTREEFETDLPSLLEAMDQPTIDGVNTWFISKAAKELGLKVAISGVGGDEIFGGYPSFLDVPRWVRWLNLPARFPGIGLAARYLTQRWASVLGFGPKAAGMLEFGGTYEGAYLLRRGLFMPWELSDILEPEFVGQGLSRLEPLRRISAVLSAGPRAPHAKIATLESSLYLRNQLLRDTDWASMAHSIEVRTPLVDSILLESLAGLVGNLPVGAGKQILASAPANPLPPEIVNRAKTGFSLPTGRWLGPLTGNTASEGRKGLDSRRWSRWVFEHQTPPERMLRVA